LHARRGALQLWKPALERPAPSRAAAAEPAGLQRRQPDEGLAAEPQPPPLPPA